MSMMALPREIVAYMVAQTPGRTDATLQPRFGISYNTWRKIERGGAIRTSVATRLIERVAREQASSAAGAMQR